MTRLYLEKNLDNTGCPKRICCVSGTISFVQRSEKATQGTGAMNLILTRKEKNLKIERNLRRGKNKQLSEFSIARHSVIRTEKSIGSGN